MRLSKKGTFVACGLVAAGLVAAGITVDRLFGTSFVFALAGTGFAALYLIGTFGASTSLFGRVARTRLKPGYFALTFDDGPDPRFTPVVSKLLAERGHRATFFVLGSHARGYPEVIAQLVDDGHELANHGDDHRLLAFARPSTVRRQLAATGGGDSGGDRRRPCPALPTTSRRPQPLARAISEA